VSPAVRKAGGAGRLPPPRGSPPILLDALARPDLYLRVVVRFQVVDVGADQSAGVELGEDPVRGPERLAPLDGDRPLVVEAETDECEHTARRAGGE